MGCTVIPNDTPNEADIDEDQLQVEVGDTACFQVWGDMCSVVDDLRDTLGDAGHENMPLKRLCDKTTALIDGSYGGNLLSMAESIVRELKNCDEEVNDLIYAFVVLLNDKKDFLKTLKVSAATDNPQQSEQDGGDDADSDVMGIDEVTTSYE